MRRTRISIFQITILVVSFIVAASSGYAESFSFISMADSRGSNNGVNDGVLSTIVSMIVQEAAQFVLFPGDLVNGSSDAGTLTLQLDHWRDITAPVYSSDMYGPKVYAGPGNHEIRNSGSEQVWQSIFSDLPSNGPAGETYMTYSFDYLNSHFVMLNTNRAGSHHTINYDWLASDLAATTADHIFVFGHEPAYPAGPHRGSSLDAHPDQRDAFWQLLIDHDVDIYFAGHEHLYNHIEVEGVHQVIAGTCGAPIYGGYGGDFYHYVLVSVDGRGVSVSVFDDNWEMRDYFAFIQSECSDGSDNDGDGLIDYPDDPDCDDSLDNSEIRPAPPPSDFSVDIDDDPLFGGHHQLDEDVDEGHITGGLVLKGNGDVEGDFDLDVSECDLTWGPLNGSVKEWGGVIRLKMRAPIGGLCLAESASGKAKIRGEIDSNGDFGGTVLIKVCVRGECESFTEPFFFALGDQHGGSWRLEIKDVEVKEDTPSEAKLSGKCTLKLGGSAKHDWLKFNLTGAYDKATGTSKLKCKGKNSFSQEAKVKITELLVGDGEIISGRVGGGAFGQRVYTDVPDAGAM